MKIKFICFAFTLLAYQLVCAQKKILNPIKHFIGTSLDTSFHQIIHQIVFDFNGDGRKDIAVSSSITWGNAGGIWEFYFKNKDNKTYHYYDKMTMHTKAYSVLKQKIKPNILITYGRENCCSGRLLYSSITKTGFKKIKIIAVGEDSRISGDEVSHIIEKKLSKGKSVDSKTADLKCLVLGKKDCWL